MKISTKGRYGLRIMLELALHHDKKLLTVKSIAEKQDISEKYIEQIIGLLNKAGLVRSQRGVSGGYWLANLPENITVGQVLRVTEGEFDIVECLSPGGANCARREECVTSEVWGEIKRAVEKVVDNITLADLVRQYNEKCSFVYMI